MKSTEDHLPEEPAKELFCHQREFNYLKGALLQKECIAEDGWIRIQKQAVPVLMLDRRTGTACLSRQFRAFTARGGHLLYWGKGKRF